MIALAMIFVMVFPWSLPARESKGNPSAPPVVRTRGRGWIADEEDNALVGSVEVAFAIELLKSRRRRDAEGRWCAGTRVKTSAGEANGRPRRKGSGWW